MPSVFVYHDTIPYIFPLLTKPNQIARPGGQPDIEDKPFSVE